MEYAIKCIKINDGVIVFANNIDNIDVENINPESDIEFYFTDYGLLIKIQDILAIPVPEVLMDYLIENNNIYIFNLFNDSYIEELPKFAITIDKNALHKVIGAFDYWKQNQKATAQNL